MLIDSIIKSKKHSSRHYDISVVIPTWNNLNYLNLCLRSLREHSELSIQIILIVNEGSDGTYEWVKKQDDIDFVYSPINLGVCLALNAARSLVASNYICYVNDDMYLLPKWDRFLMDEIISLGTKSFMLSSTLIEARSTGNPCVIVGDYGETVDAFDEQRLLQEYSDYHKPDWSGSSWPPSIVHIDTWDLVGAYAIEYSPGFYSDPDLSKRLWDLGVRTFKGVGRSRAYHFATKSTKRVKKNNGRLTFLMKHGLSARAFYTDYLHMGLPWSGPLADQKVNWRVRIHNRLKASMGAWYR